MKKYGLMFAGIFVLTFLLFFSSGLFAEEGDMHEMMDHGKMGMEKAADDVVVDPVCGMKFKPEEAAGKSEYKGKTYYFCMDADKKTFDSDPEKYIVKMEMGEPSKEMDKHHEMKHEGHWMAPVEEAAKPNPVEATDESLAKAKEIFAAKCTICHGESGKSDGVLADSLTPRPTDLTGEMTRSHSDGDLFWKISKGKGAMPAWDPSFSEDERWGLVNYIRSLSKDE